MTRPARRAGLRERLSYRFDRFMERGTVALIAGLFVVSVLIIVGVVLVLVLVRGDDGRDLPSLLWMALLRTLDPGTMGGDEGSADFVLGMLVVTFGGIFVISALIGVLNTSLEGKLAQLRKGRSRVLEHDHVLVLGWSQQIFTVLSELIEAGAGRSRTSIVVLADRDRVEMEDAIRERVTIPRRARVVCRSGPPPRISPTSRSPTPTRRARSSSWSPRARTPTWTWSSRSWPSPGRRDRRPEPYRIVAEVRERANADIARLVGGDEVHLLLADDLVARIIAQTCRQSGLSVVYLDLLDFAGDELHVTDLPELVGRTFGEAVAHVTGGDSGRPRAGRARPALPAAVTGDPPGRPDRRAGRGPWLGSGRGGTRRGGRRRRRPRRAPRCRPGANPGPRLEPAGAGGPARARRVRRGRLGGRRRVDAVTGHPRGDGRRRPAQHPGGGPGRRPHEPARAGPPGDRGVRPRDRPLRVRRSRPGRGRRPHARHAPAPARHRGQVGRTFSIVSEMLDVRNRELAEVARADDFIVSARVLSLLLAQIAETPELADVFPRPLRRRRRRDLPAQRPRVRRARPRDRVRHAAGGRPGARRGRPRLPRRRGPTTRRPPTASCSTPPARHG